MSASIHIAWRMAARLACGMLLLLSCGPLAWGAIRSVAPDHPLSRDAGEGGPDKPYHTLSYAMQRLLPGDTLLVYPGTYREALIFPQRAWSTAAPTTIVGVGSGHVTLVGADVVEGWSALGNGMFVKRPWLQQPQQVIVNGELLKQVGGTIFDGYPTRAGHALAGLHRSQGGIWPGRLAGGRDTMPPDSFFYDEARHELVVRKNLARLSDATVQVSTRMRLVYGQDVAGVTIRNLRLRYANTTTLSRQGALTLIGQGNTLSKLVVEDADGAGIEITGDDNAIVDCVVTRAGYLGIKARGKRNRIVGNRVSGNNTRGFNKWWEAGGMKFIGDGGLHDSTVADNVVTHNHGDGIWFDWGNDANRVQRNIAAYNEGFGIHYEASSHALITDNQAFANRQRGIYLPHSRDSIVAHNLVIANGLEGIAIIDEGRRDPEGKLDLRPYNNVVMANLIAWNKGPALVLPGEQFNNRSDANLYLQEKESPDFSMGWPRYWSDRKNLNRWRETQEQDRGSIAVSAAMDGRIAQALAHEDIHPDWSGLAGFQSMLSVPAQQSNAALLSDRILSNRAGPR